MSIFDLLLKRAESDQGIHVANKKKYYSNILLIDRSLGRDATSQYILLEEINYKSNFLMTELAHSQLWLIVFK